MIQSDFEIYKLLDPDRARRHTIIGTYTYSKLVAALVALNLLLAP